VKGGKTKYINNIAPLPRERGWGEVKLERGNEGLACKLREINGLIII
jgi:hypothetical protein